MLPRARVAMISCNVYISEGRSAARLAALERAAGAAARAQRPAGACAHVYSFTDAPYHRSSFTFVGAPRAVASAARALAAAALGEGIGLDLREVRERVCKRRRESETQRRDTHTLSRAPKRNDEPDHFRIATLIRPGGARPW